MTDPITVMGDLEAHALELDKLSKELAQVERDLEPVTREYEEFMGAYEEGLWHQHMDLGAKFPAEALRTRMGHRAMAPELLGSYMGLLGSRRRLEKRVSTLKSVVDAKRSILSALKVELEASR